MTQQIIILNLIKNGNSTVISLFDIMDADYEYPVPEGKKITALLDLTKLPFLTYYINTCFGKLCQELLVSLPKDCNKNLDTSKQQIF